MFSIDLEAFKNGRVGDLGVLIS